MRVMKKVKQQFDRLMGSGDRRHRLSLKGGLRKPSPRRGHLSLELSAENKPEINRKQF